MAAPTHTAALTLALALGAGAAHAQADAADLAGWTYDALYENGWSADALLETEVRDAAGATVGTVADIAVSDAQAVGLVVAGDGLTDGDRIVIPWQEVEIGTDGTAAVATADPGGAPAGAADVWPVSDLLDDEAFFANGDRYGTLDDAVFDQEGRLQALVVSEAGGITGALALPFDRKGWDRTAETYLFPYTSDQVADLPPFDPGRLAGGGS